ncbi:MAG: Hint domain-containing protein [Thermoplasmata archaeon]
MHTGPLTINQNNSFIDLFYIRFFWEYDPGTPLNMNVKFELKNELNTTITYHSKIFNNTLIFGTNTFNIVSDPFNGSLLEPGNYYIDVTIMSFSPPISNNPSILSGKNVDSEKVIVLPPQLTYISYNTQVRPDCSNTHTGSLVINQGDLLIDTFHIELYWTGIAETAFNMNVKFGLKNESDVSVTSHTKNFSGTLSAGNNKFNINSKLFNTILLSPGNYYIDVTITNSNPPILGLPSLSGKNNVNEKVTILSSPLTYLSVSTQVKSKYNEEHSGSLIINQNDLFIDTFRINLNWNGDTGVFLNMNVKFELKNDSNTTVTYHNKIFNNTLRTGINTFEVISDTFNTSLLDPGNYHIDVSITFSNPPISDIPSLFLGINDSNEKVTVPSYLKGTNILTPKGEVLIEDLKEEDDVITYKNGNIEIDKIKWKGTLTPKELNEDSYPIKISKSAIREGVPYRDLYVSPGHSVYLDGKLVLAKTLVNGETIYQDKTIKDIKYYHIELSKHTIVFAEGMCAESYLDVGNRGSFDECRDGTRIIVRKDFTKKAIK